MSLDAPRPARRPEPALAWTVVTDAPLKGLDLAREAGLVLAWDEADHLVLFDLNGRRVAEARAQGKIQHAAISDDGSLAAAILAGPRLWLFGDGLEPIDDRATVADPGALAIDPHGRFLAVASGLGTSQLYNRHGRQAGRFETRQPLSQLLFLADRPLLLGASGLGSIVAVELTPGASAGTLAAEVLYEQRLLSTVGRLEATGDGGMVLAACYNHGVQRYDLKGQNEGAYHLGGTAAHAVPDFAGRIIAVATTEGELAILNRAGNVRWKSKLSRPAVGLEVDGLGRFLITGLGSGEVARLDLEAPSRSASARSQAPQAASGARPGSVRAPAWNAPVAKADTQAESAVLAVLDDPPRIAVLTNSNRLHLFNPAGGDLGQAPQIHGVGRFLRTAPGWIAASTDRQILLYDARRNGVQKVELNLVEVTHLAIRPDSYGLAIIQERDRVGRSTPTGHWTWRRELNSPVEDLAIVADGLTALTTDDGRLLVFDPTGEPAGRYQADPVEPLGLVEAPPGSPPEVVWLSLARRAQVLRSHRADGRVLWETPIPWESWQLHRVDPVVIVTAPDGRALAFDGSGRPRSQGRTPAPLGPFGTGPGEAVWRLARRGEHLICSDLDGRVLWRAIADAPLGPVAAGRLGVAALIGRDLAWFPAPEAD